MSIRMKSIRLMFLTLGAVSLGTSAALAASRHTIHRAVQHHAMSNEQRYAECFARMQPGDMAIFIQGRFSRESGGVPFWKGECPNREPKV
jgi:precorrin-6x reductase